MDSQAVLKSLRLDDDHRRFAPHPLSRPRTGADARLPGAAAYNLIRIAKISSGSRMKQRFSHVLHPAQRIKPPRIELNPDLPRPKRNINGPKGTSN